MPLVSFQKTSENGLLLWELKEKVEDFKLVIPDLAYQEVLDSTRLEKRKLEKLSQLALLKTAGINISDLSYNKNGKPLLNSEKHLSFSHSGNLSALLVNKNVCGMDLELASDKIIRISSKFINENENALMLEKENIYWAWSIKESIFKYFGERVLFKDHINIVEIEAKMNRAKVHYCGFHGRGDFEINLLRIKNYYLAYTKSYYPK